MSSTPERQHKPAIFSRFMQMLHRRLHGQPEFGMGQIAPTIVADVEPVLSTEELVSQISQRRARLRILLGVSEGDERARLTSCEPMTGIKYLRFANHALGDVIEHLEKHPR